jgi:phosphoribosylformimino-5-aminoimidazole carboxamide ribotide isomerase
MSFILYPAIDVRGGRVVRLRQGDYARETTYAGDPVEVARAWREAGAEWLHLVDLDAARAGGYTLLPTLQRIVASTGLRVQTGGGVRDAAAVEAIRAAGAERVVIGTLGVRSPATVIDWLQRFGPEHLTLALDTRLHEGDWTLPVQGWTEGSGERLSSVLAAYRGSGLKHLLCTDIGRDGMLTGPNLTLYGLLRSDHPELAVQASGGVRDGVDLVALRELGVAGAVAGRALLDGRMNLAEALAC